MKTLALNVDMLIQALDEGHKPKYLLFWGHTAQNDKMLAKECLSQWLHKGQAFCSV